MKLKILICILLVISMIFCIVGCVNREVEIDGVTYELHNLDGEKFYYIGHISSTGDNSPLYIPDEINGIPVIGIGHSAMVGNYSITISGIEKIYFPWSINYSPHRQITYIAGTEYIISASTTTLIDELDKAHIFIIPNEFYEKKVKHRASLNNINCTVPGNVSYFFNYDNNPNDGYFFVDLIEETGKLTKPPYDPKRDGYKFAGWYKEEGCTNQWNFETDTVTINFDKNGERIYEEIKLYAKWEQNN